MLLGTKEFPNKSSAVPRAKFLSKTHNGLWQTFNEVLGHLKIPSQATQKETKDCPHLSFLYFPY